MLTPEEICQLTADHPDIFAELFRDSKDAGAEMSATVCLVDDELHLENHCTGDECSVTSAELECKDGEPVSIVHTHIQQDAYADWLSLQDMLNWLITGNDVNCIIPPSRWPTCFTTIGNYSLRKLDQYINSISGTISEKNIDEIVEFSNKLPDPTSAYIALDAMLINFGVKKPDNPVKYWQKYDYIREGAGIKPCPAEGNVKFV